MLPCGFPRLPLTISLPPYALQAVAADGRDQTRLRPPGCRLLIKLTIVRALTTSIDRASCTWYTAFDRC